MKLRFVIDAQLPPSLATHLEICGHAAEHVSRLRVRASSDVDIWAYVRRLGAVLITKDEDFVGLVQRSPSGPTLVWIKLGNTRNRVLLAAVSRALPGVIEAIAAGERLIVIE